MLVMVKAVKAHRCFKCLRKIPKGEKYWADKVDDTYRSKEHTNCLLFEHEPILPDAFEIYRSKWDDEGYPKTKKER